MKAKPTKIKMLTQKKYIASGGDFCPLCSSADVESGPVQADGSHAWAKVSCGNCNADWNDVYQLAGFENLQMEIGWL